MTSAVGGRVGVAQNLTKTDMGEGGGGLILTSYLEPIWTTTSKVQVSFFWSVLGPHVCGYWQ